MGNKHYQVCKELLRSQFFAQFQLPIFENKIFLYITQVVINIPHCLEVDPRALKKCLPNLNEIFVVNNIF